MLYKKNVCLINIWFTNIRTFNRNVIFYSSPKRNVTPCYAKKNNSTQSFPKKGWMIQNVTVCVTLLKKIGFSRNCLERISKEYRKDHEGTTKDGHHVSPRWVISYGRLASSVKTLETPYLYSLDRESEGLTDLFERRPKCQAKRSSITKICRLQRQ